MSSDTKYINASQAALLLDKFRDKPDQFDSITDLVLVSLTKRGKFVVSTPLSLQKPSAYAKARYRSEADGVELARWKQLNKLTVAFSNGLIVELHRNGNVVAYQQMEGKENA